MLKSEGLKSNTDRIQTHGDPPSDKKNTNVTKAYERHTHRFHWNFTAANQKAVNRLDISDIEARRV